MLSLVSVVITRAAPLRVAAKPFSRRTCVWRVSPDGQEGEEGQEEERGHERQVRGLVLEGEEGRRTRDAEGERCIKAVGSPRPAHH